MNLEQIDKLLKTLIKDDMSYFFEVAEVENPKLEELTDEQIQKTLKKKST